MKTKLGCKIFRPAHPFGSKTQNPTLTTRTNHQQNTHHSPHPPSQWSTSQRPARPSVAAAASTPCAKSPSTRPERPRPSPRESDVTIANSLVMEVRLSLCSTRRLRLRRVCGWFTDWKGGEANWQTEVVLRLECTTCKYKNQLALKRCKHFVRFWIRVLWDLC